MNIGEWNRVEFANKKNKNETLSRKTCSTECTSHSRDKFPLWNDFDFLKQLKSDEDGTDEYTRRIYILSEWELLRYHIRFCLLFMYNISLYEMENMLKRNFCVHRVKSKERITHTILVWHTYWHAYIYKCSFTSTCCIVALQLFFIVCHIFIVHSLAMISIPFVCYGYFFSSIF